MPTTHRWVVDAIEEFVASIEVDGKTMITLPQWILPDAVKQGDVIRVTHERPPKGAHATLTLEIDHEATKKALADSVAQARKGVVNQRDKGGDIIL